MTCREFIDFLMAYLDRELEASQRSVFEDHMSQCPECVDYLSNYQQTVALGKTICGPDDDLPPDVPELLVRAILAARNEAG